MRYGWRIDRERGFGLMFHAHKKRGYKTGVTWQLCSNALINFGSDLLALSVLLIIIYFAPTQTTLHLLVSYRIKLQGPDFQKR